MNMKRVLLAGMVLVLTGACAWAETEIAGFAAIPESEAAQIVGGDGYVCDYTKSITHGPTFVPCVDNGNHTGCLYGAWYYEYPRYGCKAAESGECYTDVYVHFEYGACAWKGETPHCAYDGEVYFIYIADVCG
jgi:hypothetical protein